MIGTQIGNYRILEKLGEGGMGVVYKGVDIGLDRPVAIKVLNPEFSHNPELVQRFQAEAKAQAHLNHFNLATLYAFLVEQGNAVMVMEFVDGETFAQMIARRGPIPAEEAIPLFKQALLGISTAHRMGIVHRDIKPSNLMLNKNGIVKVMDFGIAKVMGTRGMTRTGIHVGTVAYMSPEQIQNRSVDIRSDIYALGVTLYEMLSGRLPFEADNDFQIMHDHVHTPPPPPRRFYPYIPEGIENVLLKALAKQPDERFQSVEEFGAALEHPERVPAPAAAPATAPGLGATVVDRASLTPPPSYSTTPLPGSPSYGQTIPAGSATPVPAAAGGSAAQPASSAIASTPLPLTPGFWTLRNKAVAGAILMAVVVLVGWAVLRHPGAGGAGGAAGPGPTHTVASTGGLTLPQAGPTVHTIAGTGAGGTGNSASAPGPSSGSASTSTEEKTQPVSAAPPSMVAVPFDRLQVRRKVYATYPTTAISQGVVSGIVRVAAEIDEDGRVVKVAPRSGLPVLYHAADMAAGRWRFEPYQQNGQPVKVTTEFEVPFKPVQLAQVQQPQTQSPPSSYQTQPSQQPVQTPTPQPLRQTQPSYQSPQLPAQVQSPEQTQPTPTPPAPSSGTFATRAVHRVRLVNGMSYWCTGNLAITSDGSLSYSNDASSRPMASYINVCRSFSVRLDKLKHVGIDPAPQTVNGYQFVHLHLEKGWAHKADLFVPANMADALQKIVNPWLK